jgi:predicted flap endonuclease-1-like 5' DNA nuclease
MNGLISRRRWRLFPALALLGFWLAPLPLAQAQSEAARQNRCLSIGRDVLIAAGEVKACNVVVIGASLTIEPEAVVNGNVNVVGGNAVIGGTVNGSVFVSGDVTLAGTAEVQGTVSHTGAIDQDPAAVVHGLAPTPSATRQAVPTIRVGRPSGPPWAVGLGGLLGALLAALVVAAVVAVAPGATERAGLAATASPAATFLVGLLASLVFPFLMILLVVTIVGPVLLGLLYTVAGVLGGTAIGEVVGRRLWRGGPRPGQAALGAGLMLALLALVSLLGVPGLCLSFLGWVVLSSWALGASALTVLGTRPWPRLPGGEPSPQPSPAPAVPATAETAGAPAAAAAAAADVGTAVGGPVAWPEEGAAMPATLVVAAAAGEGAGDEPEALAAADEGAAGPEPGTAPLAAAVATGEAVGAAPHVTAGMDLTAVPGLSPIYAQLLRGAGIGGLADLAAASPDDVAAAASAPGVLPIDTATAGQWIQAARQRLEP